MEVVEEAAAALAESTTVPPVRRTASATERACRTGRRTRLEGYGVGTAAAATAFGGTQAMQRSSSNDNNNNNNDTARLHQPSYAMGLQ